MKKLIKTTIILSVAIIFMGLVAACTKTVPKNPSLSDIEAAMKQKVDFKDMLKLDDAKLQKLYGLNTSELDGSFVYISSSNVKAEEIAVIKVKDSSKVSEVKDKINKRIEKQSKSLKDYVPDQYSLVQSNILKDKGTYIFFVVSDNKDKFEQAFDNAFK